MKKHFLTGLAILLPAILTLVIVIFLVNLFTDPFINGIEGVHNTFSLEPLNLTKSTGTLLKIRFIILIFIFFFIILIGFLTQTLFMYSFISITDDLIKRIPFINKVYKALQDVIQTLFSSNGSSFKQVVLVPYPNENSLSIGFLTTDTISQSNDFRLKDKVPVFVPGTPNPTFGFILIFPRDQVVKINMKVEEAFKVLVSCGIMLPNVPGIPHEPKT